MTAPWTWRVWRAFDREPLRDHSKLWRALAESCRDVNGRIDGVEFDRWVQIILDNDHGACA